MEKACPFLWKKKILQFSGEVPRLSGSGAWQYLREGQYYDILYPPPLLHKLLLSPTAMFHFSYYVLFSAPQYKFKDHKVSRVSHYMKKIIS